MRALLLLLLGCAAHPKHDEAIEKYGRHTQWKEKVTAATFSEAAVTVTFGSHLEVAIPSCYAHAQSRIGDHDHIAITIDGVPAKDGELDIVDCTTKHVTATLWATTVDGMRVDATFDTDLGSPGK